MEQVKLNKDQLQELVSYINKCSFREPVIVMEILDHFACKVEEIMTEHPDYPLTLAMVQAHESFGVMGFHPIASKYTDMIQRKYRKLFYAWIKKILSSVWGMILCFAAGALIYKGYIWTVQHHFGYRGDANICFYGLMACCVLAFILLRFSLLRKRKNNSLIMGSVINLNNFWSTPFFLVFFLPSGHHISNVWLMLCAMWNAIFAISYFVSEIAFYKVSRIALKDIEESEANYKMVLG